MTTQNWYQARCSGKFAGRSRSSSPAVVLDPGNHYFDVKVLSARLEELSVVPGAPPFPSPSQGGEIGAAFFQACISPAWIALPAVAATGEPRWAQAVIQNVWVHDWTIADSSNQDGVVVGEIEGTAYFQYPFVAAAPPPSVVVPPNLGCQWGCLVAPFRLLWRFLSVFLVLGVVLWCLLASWFWFYLGLHLITFWLFWLIACLVIGSLSSRWLRARGQAHRVGQVSLLLLLVCIAPLMVGFYRPILATAWRGMRSVAAATVAWWRNDQCTSAGEGGCQRTGRWVGRRFRRTCSALPRTSGSCHEPAAGVCITGGNCVCSAGRTDCGGSCRDILTDRENCGGCGQGCGDSQACSHGVCVGTGLLRVTMTWDRDGDMDLHVVPPCRDEILFSDRSGCGGYLDHDDTTHQGPENVFWRSEPAAGDYLICAVPYTIGAPTNFVVEVYRGSRLAQTFRGSRRVSASSHDCSLRSPDLIGIYHVTPGDSIATVSMTPMPPFGARPAVTRPSSAAEGADEPPAEEHAGPGDSASAHRGELRRRFRYHCPADFAVGSVWGTDVYTDDSSVCTAAVHAGRISSAVGGTVRIEILAGRSSYRGSERHGVDSDDYGDWDGSFVFR